MFGLAVALGMEEFLLLHYCRNEHGLRMVPYVYASHRRWPFRVSSFPSYRQKENEHDFLT